MKSKLLKFLIFFIAFHLIYIPLVRYYPLISLNNEQGSKLNDFLVSLGNPNTEEAYYLVFNSVFIAVHAIVSLIILGVFYYIIKKIWPRH